MLSDDCRRRRQADAYSYAKDLIANISQTPRTSTFGLNPLVVALRATSRLRSPDAIITNATANTHQSRFSSDDVRGDVQATVRATATAASQMVRQITDPAARRGARTALARCMAAALVGTDAAGRLPADPP